MGAFTARTIFETPYQALAPDLSPDYDERTRSRDLARHDRQRGRHGGRDRADGPARPSWRPAPDLSQSAATVGRVHSSRSLGALVAFVWRARAQASTPPGAASSRFLQNLRRILGFPVRNRPARTPDHRATRARSLPPPIPDRGVPVRRTSYVFVRHGPRGTPSSGPPSSAPCAKGRLPRSGCDPRILLGRVSVRTDVGPKALRTRDKKHGYIFAFVLSGHHGPYWSCS